jgi:carboxylate-amine ligase
LLNALDLQFKANRKHLTLGAEIELQVLDAERLILTPRSSEILGESGIHYLTSEFFQSTLECVSPVCANVQELQHIFTLLFQKLVTWGKPRNLTFASSGTNPLADYRDRLITPSDRYQRLLEKNQWLIRRRAVYGLHIHLGMTSGEACIRYANFFQNFIPHLIALTASSPFWQRMNTGLICCRPTLFEALPTAGTPYPVASWREFKSLYKTLRKSKSIDTIKDVSWDIRPSPLHGTLEIRICDATSLPDTLAVISFVHALAFWFQEHGTSTSFVQHRNQLWITRENKWRAIRSGLAAEIVSDRTGRTIPIRESIEYWVSKIRPFTAKLQYEKYIDRLLRIVQSGNSADRQLQVFADTQNLADVAKHNVLEFMVDR